MCESLRDYVVTHKAAVRQTSSHVHADPTTTNSLSTAAASSAHSLAATSTSARTCAFCGKSHPSYECRKYPDATSRRQHSKDRCFICLRNGQNARTCKSTSSCYYCKSKHHHSSLCPTKFPAPQASVNAAKATSASSPSLSSFQADAPGFASEQHQLSALASDHGHCETVLQTALVPLTAGDQLAARFLFDTGSTKTFVTESLHQRANFPVIGHDTISVARFGDQRRQSYKCAIVEIQFTQLDGTTGTLIARTLPNITSPVKQWPVSAQHDSILRTLPLAEPLTATGRLPIDVLVGLDFYYEIVCDQRLQLADGLFLLQSSVGFLLTVQSAQEADDTALVMSCEPVPPDISRFWAVEEVGTAAPLDDDAHVLDMVRRSIQFENGRYTVTWPWLSAREPLPSNYPLALGRLRSLVKRLELHPDLKLQYHSLLQDQLAKGIIESAPSSPPTGSPVHYLPHHCVIKPGHTTTKVRVVYDASAKSSSRAPSLKDCLHSGPSLLPDLCGILLRFRIHPVAVIADVEKAFLQLNLAQDDRDVTRFLWLNDINQPATANNVRSLRFCRVPFGVVSSPFLLAATLDHQLRQDGSPAALQALHNTYVDNLITGTMCVSAATQLYLHTKSLFASAGMNLREWSSNSPQFLLTFDRVDRSTTSPQRCLSLLWSPDGDTLAIDPVQAGIQLINTKRQLLQIIAKCFNPLGLITPVTVAAKILFQSIWLLNLDWDDPLLPDILSRWLPIASNIDAACAALLPRFIGCLPDAADVRYELHVFADASEAAYAAAAYLRITTSQHTSVHIIFSKSRVAPTEPHTIPRLELLAAVIGSRMITFLQTELPLNFSTTVLWSDSSTVLHWLQSTRRPPTSVHNRVAAIQSVPDVAIGCIRSADNPADLLSRGIPAAALKASSLWWHGPNWLRRAYEVPPLPPGECLSEFPKRSGDRCLVNMSQNNKKSDACKEVLPPFGIDCTHFSSLGSLVRVSALCLRFVCRLRGAESLSGPVTVEEQEQAKLMWIKHVQASEYADVLTALRQRKGAWRTLT